MTVAVSLSLDARAELERLAMRDYPHEACGTLLGSERRDGTLHIEHVRSARNLASDPSLHFELHPGDLVRAEQFARENGLEIIGIWHTHPDQPARLSASDVQGVWNGWIQLIASVDANGVSERRVWRLDAPSPIECPILNEAQRATPFGAARRSAEPNSPAG